MTDYRAELLKAAEELERDLDGVSDEMDLWQIEAHSKAVWLLECARQVCNPFVDPCTCPVGDVHSSNCPAWTPGRKEA